MAAAMLALSGGSADAALTPEQKCQNAILAFARAYEHVRITAVNACELNNLKGKNVPPLDCPSGDAKATAKIGKALTKLQTGIAKACCGADRTCGNGDDLALAAIGWTGLGNRCAGGDRDGDKCSVSADCPGGGVCSPADVCPSFENNAACDAIALADPGDIADCLECAGSLSTDQSLDFSYSTLKPRGTIKVAEVCKREVARAMIYYRARRNLMRVCQQKVLAGKIVGPCPDALTQPKIQKQVDKLLLSIAKKCGGPDKAFGGGNDLAPDLIGAPISCPGVDLPGPGPNCNEQLVTVQDWAQCLLCLNDYKVDCLDDLAARNAGAYNGECNAPCGNGKIDAGESCDDGNVMDGDSCPATCVIGTCTPSGGTVTVNVNYTKPEDIAGATLYIDYPESEVRIPGSGNQQAVQDRIFLQTGDFFNPNDLNYALQVVQISSDGSPFTGTQLLQIEFDTCTGASVSDGDFTCRVLDAASDGATPAPVAGVTCTVDVP